MGSAAVAAITQVVHVHYKITAVVLHRSNVRGTGVSCGAGMAGADELDHSSATVGACGAVNFGPNASIAMLHLHAKYFRVKRYRDELPGGQTQLELPDSSHCTVPGGGAFGARAAVVAGAGLVSRFAGAGLVSRLILRVIVVSLLASTNSGLTN